MKHILRGRINNKNNGKIYLEAEGKKIPLYLSEDNIDPADGQSIEAFCYQDKKHQWRAQYPIPEIINGEFIDGEVVATNPELGVFIDVGLYEKDIVVSFDDLPQNHKEWPKLGDTLYVKLYIDSKQRYWGQLRPMSEWVEEAKKAPARLMNQELNVNVISLNAAGFNGWSEEGYLVFVHDQETNQQYRLGQSFTVRIIKVHSDGRLNGSLKPRAHEMIDDDASMIKAFLAKKPNHYIPLHDKSPVEDINKTFGISKSQFKRAVGKLMKNGVIRQVPGDGIYMNENFIES